MTESPPGEVLASPMLQVSRWRRYGKDRLYVLAGDKTLGFWDLVTDQAHPETPDQLALLTSAVARWKSESEHDSAEASNTQPAAAASPAAPTTVVADAAVRPWIDLSANKPGAEARDQALSARDVAPVKTAVARVFGLKTDERAWRIGADGEELVAAKLAKIAKKDPRWRVLHSIPVGNRGSDIDHLVIGPGGVFTVNTKHHPKAKIWVGGNTFLVDGHRQPYVRNSRYEAERAARLLSAVCGFAVPVEGLIVTVNARDVTVKSQPDGVSVTWRNNVARWLLSHGDVLDDHAVTSVYEAARRSTTWVP